MKFIKLLFLSSLLLFALSCSVDNTDSEKLSSNTCWKEALFAAEVVHIEKAYDVRIVSMNASGLPSADHAQAIAKLPAGWRWIHYESGSDISFSSAPEHWLDVPDDYLENFDPSTVETVESFKRLMKASPPQSHAWAARRVAEIKAKAKYGFCDIHEGFPLEKDAETGEIYCSICRNVEKMKKEGTYNPY
jgi:hypothetical protein